MRVVLAADFPVYRLPSMEGIAPGHQATWLPPIAEEFSQISDFDFHWLICTKEVSHYREIHFLNQTFHLIPRGKLSVEILTRFAKERFQIGRLAAKLKPHFFHGWGTEQGYALAAHDFGPRSLISLQGILSAYCQASRMPLLTRIQAITEKSILSKAHHLTVESPWGKEKLRYLAPHANIDLLEYGADPACFTIACKPQDKRTAVFLGSLTHLKGLDTLLSAFSDLRLAHVHLEIYGADNPVFPKTNRPPNIRFMGHRPRAEAITALSRAWCLVHPTRADTSPNCVKEARVMGLPVVTTPNGGQTQYVEHGKSGFIYAAGDVEGFIQGVLTLTASEEASINMGLHGQSECRAVLNPATTANRLLEIYQRLR